MIRPAHPPRTGPRRLKAPPLGIAAALYALLWLWSSAFFWSRWPGVYALNLFLITSPGPLSLTIGLLSVGLIIFGFTRPPQERRWRWVISGGLGIITAVALFVLALLPDFYWEDLTTIRANGQRYHLAGLVTEQGSQIALFECRAANIICQNVYLDRGDLPIPSPEALRLSYDRESNTVVIQVCPETGGINTCSNPAVLYTYQR